MGPQSRSGCEAIKVACDIYKLCVNLVLLQRVTIIIYYLVSN